MTILIPRMAVTQSRLLFGMAGDDLVLDLVVGRFWKDAAGKKLVFGGIGAAVDDALGVSVTDAGEGFELVDGCGVDVDLVGCSGRGWFSRGGGFGLAYGAQGEGEKESGGQKLVMEIEHGWDLLEEHDFTCGRVRERVVGVNEFSDYYAQSS